MVPFMSQITRWPVELFCRRMSDLQSSLKSLFAQGTAPPQLPPNCRSYSTGWLSLGLITTVCAGPGRRVYET